ncbi:hypothetical protein PFICI_03772 [Pestalotiopsis fici W106-1]|uniref:Uncharacterized protein n=1 Tax=Pestalotiopsis fici (strain W106-1 / CGMCC3.15140) TaxID=1229662 RepID=W3XJW8_PESFW|nr:uncharacterized protein PFICI_03772 [Pestalotiopsis fici W106-1]ETS85747.1 hypothetical protein PFICI_03772 [Pestalotiopsis fici W106-1]
MALTAEQLKNHLVSYYLLSWRSTGVPADLNDILSQKFVWGLDEQTGESKAQQTDPDYAYISSEDPTTLLRINCDDSAPTDPKLRAYYSDLEGFMVRHPDIVAEMRASLDEDIELQRLILLWDTKPLEMMDTKEKIQMLARDQLLSKEELIPPSTLMKLPIYLMRVDDKNQASFQYHQAITTGIQGSQEQFLNWLNTIDHENNETLLGQGTNAFIDEIFNWDKYDNDTEQTCALSGIANGVSLDDWSYKSLEDSPFKLSHILEQRGESFEIRQNNPTEAEILPSEDNGDVTEPVQGWSMVMLPIPENYRPGVKPWYLD